MAFPIVSYGFTAHQYLFQVGAWGACLCEWELMGGRCSLPRLSPSPLPAAAPLLPTSSRPQIYPSSQRPSMKKMTTAMQRGMLLSAAMYVVVGACGYGAFGSRTAGDVLRNLGGVSASGLRLHAER